VSSRPYKIVYGIRKTGLTEDGQEREQWTQIGVAFPNQDGSLNAVLHYLPTDLTQTRLHIREPRPKVDSPAVAAESDDSAARGDGKRCTQEVFDPLAHLLGKDHRSHMEENMKIFSQFG